MSQQHVSSTYIQLFVIVEMFLLFAVPSELPIVTREHFNRWYSLMSYYLAVTFADIPIQVLYILYKLPTMIYFHVTLTFSDNCYVNIRFTYLLSYNATGGRISIIVLFDHVHPCVACCTKFWIICGG